MVTANLTMIPHAPQHSTMSLRVAWRWKTSQGPPVNSWSINLDMEAGDTTFEMVVVGPPRANLGGGFLLPHPQPLLIQFQGLTVGWLFHYVEHAHIIFVSLLCVKMHVYIHTHVQHVAYHVSWSSSSSCNSSSNHWPDPLHPVAGLRDHCPAGAPIPPLAVESSLKHLIQWGKW